MKHTHTKATVSLKWEKIQFISILTEPKQLKATWEQIQCTIDNNIDYNITRIPMPTFYRQEVRGVKLFACFKKGVKSF